MATVFPPQKNDSHTKFTVFTKQKINVSLIFIKRYEKLNVHTLSISIELFLSDL